MEIRFISMDNGVWEKMPSGEGRKTNISLKVYDSRYFLLAKPLEPVTIVQEHFNKYK